MAQAPPEGFSVSARCLAFHGPLLYESKILKIYVPDGKNDGIDVDEIPLPLREAVAYLIHYKGWKSSWDEWLPQERVLRWTDENLRLQKELKNEALQLLRSKKKPTGVVGSDTETGSITISSARESGSMTATAASSTSAASATMAYTTQKRREAVKEHGEPRMLKKSRRDVDDRDDEHFSNQDVSIVVPDILKAQLVDDWENVTKNSQLVDMPREPNVVQILKDFREQYVKRRLGNAETEILDEILTGVRLYFDKSLGSILLYRFERQQYLEMTRAYPSKTMSEIYGAEHLLRLFVSLPGLLSHTHMDRQSLNVLRAHIEELLRYLAKNLKLVFVESYINSTPAYEAISRGL
ncbi:MRG-domain-containing protein [Limtongia smithiae]|uniref:MRG-domain-containing protein n=1 Tax=Limtongia smithiae TaxID=1125753 RepID=UPI0034CD3172